MTDTEITQRFQRDTAHHEMTVLHDDGLYRHLLFRRVVVMRYVAECQQCAAGAQPEPFLSEGERETWRVAHQNVTSHQVRLRLDHVPPPAPGKRSTSSTYWFELVTWPGKLAVSGDCGSFLFSRLDDMFEFFRPGYGINPGYWSEKVLGGSTTRAYSSDLFRQMVAERAAEAEAEWPGLTAAATSRIFGDQAEWNTEYEDGAREALADFEHGATFTAACSCGQRLEGASDAAAQAWRVSHIKAPWRPAHASKVTRIEGFRFRDGWEWDMADYHWQFLWCCHAIVFGIGLYDALKAAAKEPAHA